MNNKKEGAVFHEWDNNEGKFYTYYADSEAARKYRQEVLDKRDGKEKKGSKKGSENEHEQGEEER